MDKREAFIHLWCDMWLQQQDMGIDDIFTSDVIYTESWRPEYHNRSTVKHWFREWNQRGKVLIWDIKQFFHKENQTVVEWYFENKMHDGTAEIFDGLSLIDWDGDDRICRLQEFGCNLHRYDPYADGPAPKFREAPNIWF